MKNINQDYGHLRVLRESPFELQRCVDVYFRERRILAKYLIDGVAGLMKASNCSRWNARAGNNRGVPQSVLSLLDFAVLLDISVLHLINTVLYVRDHVNDRNQRQLSIPDALDFVKAWARAKKPLRSQARSCQRDNPVSRVTCSSLNNRTMRPVIGPNPSKRVGEPSNKCIRDADPLQRRA
jgi:hypothetical protein